VSLRVSVERVAEAEMGFDVVGFNYEAIKLRQFD
jgi:hypothetical protein